MFQNGFQSNLYFLSQRTHSRQPPGVLQGHHLLHSQLLLGLVLREDTQHRDPLHQEVPRQDQVHELREHTELRLTM